MGTSRKIISLNLGSLSLFSLVLAVVLVWGLNGAFDTVTENSAASLMAEKEAYIQDHVESTWLLLDKLAAGGKTPENVALAQELLSSMRYADGSGYFFAYQKETDGYSFAFHGTKHNLWGKKADLSKPDVKVFAFRQALVYARKKGVGFVSYSYEKPLLKATKRVHFTAGEMSSSASQIAETSQALAGQATDQAASLQESAATLEDLAAHARENARQFQPARRQKSYWTASMASSGSSPSPTLFALVNRANSE